MLRSWSGLLVAVLLSASAMALAGEGATSRAGAAATNQPRFRILWFQGSAVDRGSADSGRAEGFGRLAQLLFARSFESEEAVDFNITRVLLDTADVAVVVGPGRRYSDLEARDLQAWVAAGGGLLVLAGPLPADAAYRNTLIAPYGLHFTGERSTGRPELVQDIETHPATRGVKALAGALGFFLEVSAPASALARLEGQPVLAATTHGKGRVAVLYSDQVWFNGPSDRRVVFTGLDESDNKTLALSLFAWLAGR